MRKSWLADMHGVLHPHFQPRHLCVVGELTSTKPMTLQKPEDDRYAVQFDNKLVPQTLRVIGKRGNGYQAAQGMAKGVLCIVFHPMGPNKRANMVENRIDFAWCSVLPLDTFAREVLSTCEAILEVRPKLD